MIVTNEGTFYSDASYRSHLAKKAKAEADAQAKTKAQAEGRRHLSARSATTHGLFARDVVLTHLGEDPAGYEALLAEFTAQLKPANLLERHYTEKIAAASWRLRRLHRWQAQLFEDEALTEEERLDRLDKVLRHETALHRQIDTSVKMLSRDVPRLFEARSRETALSLVQVTERDCANSPDTDWDVARTARERRTFPPLPEDFDYAALDNTHAPQPPAAGHTQNCQNEPAPAQPEGAPDAPVTQNCQNEPPAARGSEEGTRPQGISVYVDGRPAAPGSEAWEDLQCLCAPGKHGPRHAPDDKDPA